MSNFTTASITLNVVLLTAAAALSLLLFRSAHVLGDRRIRLVAIALGVLAFKSAVSIYSIHFQPWHHELAEMVNAAFDVLLVSLLVAPVFLRD